MTLVLVESAAAGSPGNGPPPAVVQQVAKVVDGNLWLRSVVSRPVFETTASEVPETYEVEVDVFVNGKKTKVKEIRQRVVRVPVSKSITESVVQRLNAKDVRVFEVNGKQLDAATILTKLRSEGPVLVSTTGELPAPELLGVFEPSALVIVLPQSDRIARAVDAVSNVDDGSTPDFVTPVPQGAPPLLTFASISTEGRLKLTNRYKLQFSSRVTRSIKKPDGTRESVPELVVGDDTHTRVRELNADAAGFFDSDNKPLTTEKALERLKQESVLLESSDSELPDSFYLRLMRKSVLIMTLPSEKAQAANAPPPPAPTAPATKSFRPKSGR
jgi:hypothetical protein